jgi:hypothetical protein
LWCISEWKALWKETTTTILSNNQTMVDMVWWWGGDNNGIGDDECGGEDHHWYHWGWIGNGVATMFKVVEWYNNWIIIHKIFYRISWVVNIFLINKLSL